jgi:hypothetical protein
LLEIQQQHQHDGATMPATSGRVRMPHNNRMHSSAALKMTGIWKNTIGYDPYAAEGEEQAGQVSASAHEQAQGLMALAKLSNKSVRVASFPSPLYDNDAHGRLCIAVAVERRAWRVQKVRDAGPLDLPVPELSGRRRPEAGARRCLVVLCTCGATCGGDLFLCG